MANREIVCKNEPNRFCYICGEVVFESNRRVINAATCLAYKNYFGFSIANQDRQWVPKVSMQNFVNSLVK